jgi:hypothetical protein
MITDISSIIISSPADYMQTSRLTRDAYTITFSSCPAILLIYNGYWAKNWVIPCTVSGAYGQEMKGIIVKTLCRLTPDKRSIVLSVAPKPCFRVSTSAGNFLSCKAVTLLRVQTSSLSGKSVGHPIFASVGSSQRCHFSHGTS